MNTYLMLVRREIWEHRSLWIAPLVWAGIITVLFTWFVFFKIEDIADGSARAVMEAQSLSDLEVSERQRESIQEQMNMPQERLQTPLAMTYLALSGLISGFAVIVVFFYLIDCLYAERRDRSILFWKSLPVSDAQVVISKLMVALIVMPIGVVLLSAMMQLLLLGIWSIKWSGTVVGDLTPDWNILAWFKANVVNAGFTFGGVMWYAPIAAYFLLLSVWARKLVFLWAVVPLVAVPLLEVIFLDKHRVAEFLADRFAGYVQQMNVDLTVFTNRRQGEHELPSVHEVYDALDMSGMFTSSETWIGIGAAAVMVFLAIRIRRHRDDS